MIRRSPSSESRGPIQQWEVTAIADAVEQWYEKGAHSAQHQKKIPHKAQTPAPNRSESVSSKGREHARPIQEEEVKPLADVAEHLITGDEEKLEEKIRALRIEEAILNYAPDVADSLRQDEKPHWVTAEQYPLLAYDAPGQMQRRYAILAHRNLGYRLRKARENDTPFTKDDVLAYCEQFRRTELPNEQYDFTLENLFAIAQRKVLLGYKMQHKSELMHREYQDAITLHNLIEDAAGLTSVESASAPAPTDTNKASTISGGDIPTSEL